MNYIENNELYVVLLDRDIMGIYTKYSKAQEVKLQIIESQNSKRGVCIEVWALE